MTTIPWLSVESKLIFHCDWRMVLLANLHLKLPVHVCASCFLSSADFLKKIRNTIRLRLKWFDVNQAWCFARSDLGANCLSTDSTGRQIVKQRHTFADSMTLQAGELFFNVLTHLVRKMAKIRNGYSQAPHLTKDTNGKVTTLQLDITNVSQ